MTKRFFLLNLLILAMGTLFLRVYQHSGFVQRNYELQRIEKHCLTLEKQRNELLSSVLLLQAPDHLLQRATAHYGMKPLTTTQVVTEFSDVTFDCLFTDTSSELLGHLQSSSDQG